jgi:hypothetical protein
MDASSAGPESARVIPPADRQVKPGSLSLQNVARRDYATTTHRGIASGGVKRWSMR